MSTNIIIGIISFSAGALFGFIIYALCMAASIRNDEARREEINKIFNAINNENERG